VLVVAGYGLFDGAGGLVGHEEEVVDPVVFFDGDGGGGG
jgi:hypothetical protein